MDRQSGIFVQQGVLGKCRAVLSGLHVGPLGVRGHATGEWHSAERDHPGFHAQRDVELQLLDRWGFFLSKSRMVVSRARVSIEINWLTFVHDRLTGGIHTDQRFPLDLVWRNALHYGFFSSHYSSRFTDCGGLRGCRLNQRQMDRPKLCAVVGLDLWGSAGCLLRRRNRAGGTNGDPCQQYAIHFTKINYQKANQSINRVRLKSSF